MSEPLPNLPMAPGVTGVHWQQAGDVMRDFRDARADYDAAKPGQFKRSRNGILPMGTGADWHLRMQLDYYRMVEIARDMVRNDAIVGQGIRRWVDNVLISAMWPEPETGNPNLNEDLKNRFMEWGEDPAQCSATGDMDLLDLGRMALEHTCVDGDILGIGTKDGWLQMFENHRLKTPTGTVKNVALGVLMDGKRRPLEYWISKEDVGLLGSVKLVGDMQTYPARMAADPALGDKHGDLIAFHVKDPRRVSQTRGVTALAPIFNIIGMRDDVEFATLVRAQIASCFAILENVEKGAPAITNKPNVTGAQRQDTNADGSQTTKMEIAPGMQYTGKEGHTLAMASPNVPAPTYFPHMNMLLTIIAVNLGVPVATMMLDPQGFSWSSARWVTDQAKVGYRRTRDSVLIGRFYRPVYRWKLRQFIAEDPALRREALRLKRRGLDLFRHVWTPPEEPYLNPVQDATARMIRERSGQSSPRRLYASDGLSIHKVTKEIIEDNCGRIAAAHQAALAEMAKPENKGLTITWREVLCMPPPEGISIKLTGQDGADGEPPQKNNNANDKGNSND